MLTRHGAPVLILFAVGWMKASAQMPSAVPPGPANPISTLSVSARLVVVPAVVRDNKGGLLNTLNRGDFQLNVDGKPQTLRYFDHDADAPLTLGLLVDTSMSQFTLLDNERAASIAFLDHMLSPADKAFVLSFDVAVRSLADVTASRQALNAGLSELATPHPHYQPAPGSSAFGREEAHLKAVRDVIGTKLFDAVDYASSRIAAKQPGRRALILLTDGGDLGSQHTVEDAINAAQAADTIIYAIDYSASAAATLSALAHDLRGKSDAQPDEPAAPGTVLIPASSGLNSGHRGTGLGGKKVLERLCGETGGKVFEVTGKETVAGIYAKIAEELRAQYRLGFSPSGGAASEGYHRIQLDLTGSAAKGKHAIQTRDGYFFTSAR